MTTEGNGALVGVSASSVALAGNGIALPVGAQITALGIVGLPDAMTEGETTALACGLLGRFQLMMEAGNALMWAVGDAYAHGERLYGDAFEQAVAASGYAPQTVSNALWVSRKVAYEDRRADLSWTHHECVAALEPKAQREMLAQAAEWGWSTRYLADEVQERRCAEAGVDPAVARAERALGQAARDVARSLWMPQWAQAVVHGFLEPLHRQAPTVDGWRGFLVALRDRVEELLKGAM